MHDDNRQVQEADAPNSDTLELGSRLRHETAPAKFNVRFPKKIPTTDPSIDKVPRMGCAYEQAVLPGALVNCPGPHVVHLVDEAIENVPGIPKYK